MKTRISITLAVALVFVCAVPGWCASDGASGFATLKSLAGQWEGKPEGKMEGKTDGHPEVITWKLVSGGSAMMEEMSHDSMVTMYHLDDNRLLMTHYCSAQNQPRMAAEVSADGKTITFNFIDGTNLNSTRNAHMHNMVLTVTDQNHITEKWTFVSNGKEQTETFHLTRKQ